MQYQLWIPRKKYDLWVRGQVSHLTKLFGGTTRTEGTGVWYDQTGLAVVEDVYIFTFLSTRPWHDLAGRVAKIESDIAKLSGEQVILSTVTEQTRIRHTLAPSEG